MKAMMVRWWSAVFLSIWQLCISFNQASVFVSIYVASVFLLHQVRFWTMRVATEIGEKRVAHSQSKEQDGMVPLKVQSLLLMKSNKQTNNQSKEQDGMVPLKVRNDSPLISMYGQFLLRKPSLVKTHFHIFLVSLKGGHWPCHLLNVVQSCGKSLGLEAFKLANLIRPRPK